MNTEEAAPGIGEIGIILKVEEDTFRSLEKRKELP